MLLAIDIGNTNIVLGLFEERDLVHHWRIVTRRDGTPDEYGILLKSLFDVAGKSRSVVTGVVIASVVPPLQPVFEEMAPSFFQVNPVVVGPGIRTGMPILYDNPREVGADRIVNAVAAYETYGGPAIVVDFGTATTFDLVDDAGNYVGSVIAPGIRLSMDALYMAAAQLPRVAVERPQHVIGKATVPAMRSGIFWGYISMIEGMVARIRAEYGWSQKILATKLGISASYLSQIENGNRQPSQVLQDKIRTLLDDSASPSRQQRV